MRSIYILFASIVAVAIFVCYLDKSSRYDINAEMSRLFLCYSSARPLFSKKSFKISWTELWILSYRIHGTGTYFYPNVVQMYYSSNPKKTWMSQGGDPQKILATESWFRWNSWNLNLETSTHLPFGGIFHWIMMLGGRVITLPIGSIKRVYLPTNLP